MSDEIKVETNTQEATPLPAPTAIAAKPEAAPRQVPQTPVTLDKLAQRRNELKKQKRKAHRHKINASNTPG